MYLRHLLTALLIPIIGTAQAETVYIENYFLAKKLEEIVPGCMEDRELNTECSDLTSITTLQMDDVSLLDIDEEENFHELHVANLNGLQYLTELKSLEIKLYLDDISASKEEFPSKLETVIFEARNNWELMYYLYDEDMLSFEVGGLPNSVKTLKVVGSSEYSENSSVRVYSLPNQLEELLVEGVYTWVSVSLPPTLKKYTQNTTKEWDIDFSNTQIEELNFADAVYYLGNGEFADYYEGDSVGNLILPPSVKRFKLNFYIVNASDNQETIPPFNYFKLNEGLEEFIIDDYSELTLLPDLPASLKLFEINRNIFDDQIRLNDGLETLKIIGSKLSELPPNLPGSLKNIDLSENNLVYLPNFPNQLQTLNVSKNSEMKCLPVLPASLTSLNTSNTKITCIPNETNTIKATVALPVCTEPCGEKPDLLSGIIFLDLNKNGVLDPTDKKIQGAFVNVDGKIITSNSNGEYRSYANPDAETKITVTYNHPHLDKILPAQRTYTNSGNSINIDTLNFAVQLKDAKDVDVLISPFRARNGFTSQVYITITNRGTVPVNNFKLSLHAPLDWTIKNTSPVAQSISDSILWNNIGLDIGQSKTYIANLTVPASATVGTPYSITAKLHQITDDVNLENNTNTYSSVITGSYDPNDKLVTPEILAPNYAEGTELIYTVRFQNTGNDTAFNVVVLDTILEHLDPLTLRVIEKSHPLEWSLNENREVTFNFNNINLPDSNVNEVASHGFVTFAIQPLPNLPSGTIFDNRAAIYFDFNTPIITNYATSKVEIITAINEKNAVQLNVYPNPTKDVLNIRWNESGKTNLSISDISGKVIFQSVEIGNYKQISTQNLSKGMYIIQSQNEQGLGISKIIVQ
jgi:hypothetical protein